MGAEKFLPDASEVMNELLKHQTETVEQTEMEDDDPQISYMISAWARMCKIIGKDFVQYLSMYSFYRYFLKFSFSPLLLNINPTRKLTDYYWH